MEGRVAVLLPQLLKIPAADVFHRQVQIDKARRKGNRFGLQPVAVDFFHLHAVVQKQRRAGLEVAAVLVKPQGDAALLHQDDLEAALRRPVFKGFLPLKRNRNGAGAVIPGENRHLFPLLHNPFKSSRKAQKANRPKKR